jgi:hypothetical protein
VNLLERVVDRLGIAGVSHCLIGAAAMAAHGVPRSTLDLDLLTTDRQILEEPFWAPLREAGVKVEVRKGDLEDPLAGVVRISAPDERAVDVIVGRFSWQSDIVNRAPIVNLHGMDLRVAEPVDLILLKLYAGGPQDRWDIQQMLMAQRTVDLLEKVEMRLGHLPRECAELWGDLRPTT